MDLPTARPGAARRGLAGEGCHPEKLPDGPRAQGQEKQEPGRAQERPELTARVGYLARRRPRYVPCPPGCFVRCQGESATKVFRGYFARQGVVCRFGCG